LHLLTKKARRTYAESTYRDGDFLVFGSESTGIPEEVLAAHPASCERIPMLPDATSLANRDAWAAHEASLGDAAASAGASASPLTRQDICGNFVNVDDWRISALNLSNAVAVVLYEALRQTGFAGMGDGA
ncbi:MAG: TrmH family RNA methyltransferase, partial [Parafannyhessea umbonata]